jgi:hypothetical protein
MSCLGLDHSHPFSLEKTNLLIHENMRIEKTNIGGLTAPYRISQPTAMNSVSPKTILPLHATNGCVSNTYNPYK